ncbi:MAG: MFS transporter [Deltaproteobacteria bacterium]|nr:MFS transporter [Deltaproteobacteria bacterium]
MASMTAHAKPLAARTLLTYGGPLFALAYLLFFVQFYFLKFATDVLLLPPAAVGALFALAKVWDAASNPLVGSWSDRTRSRFGRRRPFLVGALPVLALGFVMLWTPPHLGTAAMIAWAAVSLFVFFTAFALYAVPHAALGAELSPDSHQRTRLFGARQMSFTLGMLLAFGAIQVAMNAAEPRAATAMLALPGALAAIALLAVTPLAIREPAGERRGGQSLRSGLRDVFTNRPARILVLVWFIEALGAGAVGTMGPYVAEYLMRRPDIVGTLPAAYVLSGVVSIPVWVRLARRFGGRDTWLAAMLLAAAAFGGMMVVQEGDLTLLFVLLSISGCAMGCGNVLAASLMADIIDLDEQRTGERKEGVYSAAMLFALKFGSSLATAVTGIVLGIAGFVPNVEQSAASLFGMRLLFAGMPCLGFLAGALIFRGFPLGGGGVPLEVAPPLRGLTRRS